MTVTTRAVGRRGPPLGAVVVVTGGDAFDPALAAAALASLPPDVPVIAADSGADHALGAGLSVSHLVGDFDSLHPDTLDRLAAGGTRIERHPVDKDATDLELALDAAEALGARRVARARRPRRPPRPLPGQRPRARLASLRQPGDQRRDGRGAGARRPPLGRHRAHRSARRPRHAPGRARSGRGCADRRTPLPPRPRDAHRGQHPGRLQRDGRATRPSCGSAPGASSSCNPVSAGTHLREAVRVP